MRAGEEGMGAGEGDGGEEDGEERESRVSVRIGEPSTRASHVCSPGQPIPSPLPWFIPPPSAPLQRTAQSLPSVASSRIVHANNYSIQRRLSLTNRPPTRKHYDGRTDSRIGIMGQGYPALPHRKSVVPPPVIWVHMDSFPNSPHPSHLSIPLFPPPHSQIS